MTAAGVEIEVGNMRTAPEELLRAMYELDRAFELEAKPDEPPPPWDSFHAEYRSTPSHRDVVAVLARRDGEAVGGMWVELDRSGTNAHLVEVFANVLPEHRRHAVGREMMRSLVEIAQAEQRTMLFVFTNSLVPSGGEVMRHLGAKAGLEERSSELRIADIDRSLVQQWADDGARRAPDYELILVEDDVPDELVDGFAALYAVTNTAPRDELEMEDSHRTPQQVRDNDVARRAAGRERLLLLARHRPTGDLVGWTELSRHPADPAKVHQQWTAVDAAHRGHALGKWLKGAATARLLERWPDAEKIVTGNAYSNDAMLGINDALGFKETEAWTVWQMPMAEVETYLGSDSGSR